MWRLKVAFCERHWNFIGLLFSSLNLLIFLIILSFNRRLNGYFRFQNYRLWFFHKFIASWWLNSNIRVHVLFILGPFENVYIGNILRFGITIFVFDYFGEFGFGIFLKVFENFLYLSWGILIVLIEVSQIISFFHFFYKIEMLTDKL